MSVTILLGHQNVRPGMKPHARPPYCVRLFRQCCCFKHEATGQTINAARKGLVIRQTINAVHRGLQIEVLGWSWADQPKTVIPYCLYQGSDVFSSCSCATFYPRGSGCCPSSASFSCSQPSSSMIHQRSGLCRLPCLAFKRT